MIMRSRAEIKSAVTKGKGGQGSKGYTLVELMVGLSISLLTGAVAMTFIISSSRMLANQSAEDVIQENARFALEILASSVRLAGSNTSNDLQTQSLSQGVFRGSICGTNGNEACNQQNTAYQAGVQNVNQINATTDRLAVEYVTNTGRTCSGQAINFEQRVVHVFYVAENNGISSLYCQAYLSTLDFATQSFDTYNSAGNAVPLIEGVEMLQVQYGVDTDGTAEETIDRYVNFTTLSGNTAWFDRIKAIKIGLLLSNSSESSANGIVNTEISEARSYQLLDGSLTANDAILRQAVSTTVFLPNSTSNI